MERRLATENLPATDEQPEIKVSILSLSDNFSVDSKLSNPELVDGFDETSFPVCQMAEVSDTVRIGEFIFKEPFPRDEEDIIYTEILASLPIATIMTVEKRYDDLKAESTTFYLEDGKLRQKGNDEVLDIIHSLLEQSKGADILESILNKSL